MLDKVSTAYINLKTFNRSKQTHMNYTQYKYCLKLQIIYIYIYIYIVAACYTILTKLV